MMEIKLVGVKAEAVQWVIAIAVFHVTADWMPHVGSRLRECVTQNTFSGRIET